MDISRHLNLIRNHGYKGKIGILKESVSMITKAGDVVLYRPYIPNNEDSEEEQEYDKKHCSIEFPYSEEDIQKKIKIFNSSIKTFGTCVGVPLSMIEEIVID